MSDDVDDYEDVTGYTLSSDREQELLTKQTECTFIWANRDGFPVGVIMNYVFADGRFWLTASGQRKRIAAVRRDPRVSIAITSRGAGISTSQSLTYKGQCIVHDDEPTKQWFYPLLAAAVRPGDEAKQAAFAAFLDSPRRVVLEIVPEQRIGFDSDAMFKATPSAAPE
jgi:hypothetical protein